MIGIHQRTSYGLVRRIFPWIDLDPCSNANSTVGAIKTFDLASDGLKSDWGRNEFVYINPPYGRIWVNPERIKTSSKKVDGWESSSIYDWIKKAYVHSNEHGGHVLILCPVAPGTKHWQEFIFKAHATGTARIGFFKGRLTFIGAKGKAPMDCAMVLFSANRELQNKFLIEFNKVGFAF